MRLSQWVWGSLSVMLMFISHLWCCSKFWKTYVSAPTSKAVEPKPAPKKAEPVSKTYKIAGTSYRQDAIRSLGEKNPDFSLTKREMFKRDPDEQLYEYTFNPKKVELVPEPENPHDPNAIMVLIDGAHVGYIKSGSCAHLLKVIREDRIEKIEANIFGGKCKYLCSFDADASRLEDYDLEKDEKPFGVYLSILEKRA